MDIEDVLGSDGASNNAGTKIILSYARYSTFDTLQGLPAGTDFSDKMVISTDHTFTTGNCFKKIEVVVEGNGLQSNMVGERQGKAYENMLSFRSAGNKKEFLAFLEEVKNDNLVVIVEDMEGQLRQLGLPGVPAHFDSGDTNTGAAIGDFRGHNYVIKSVGHIAPVYTGTISYTPAA